MNTAKPIHGEQPNPHGFCREQLAAIRQLGDSLTETPPAGCAYTVGQKVEYTNGNGLTANGFRPGGIFHPFQVLGFTSRPHSCGEVWLFASSWWFPVKLSDLNPSTL